MSYIPDSNVLRGLPLHLAECYGKPHIGSRYTADDAKRYRLEEGALCASCGRVAANSHHLPPLSKGRHFLLATDWGQFVLKPSLIALCGSGTTGCHGMAHSHDLTIRWVWKSDDDAEAWWTGWMLSHGFTPHDPKLYEHGWWELTEGGATWRVS